MRAAIAGRSVTAFSRTVAAVGRRHRHHPHSPNRRPPRRRAASSAGTTPPPRNGFLSDIRSRPLEYAVIPAVAAFVGLSTNYMGVKMLFYPIEYIGTEWHRWGPGTPWGLIGWQGVVPCKTEKMAGRLVEIVTKRLLSLPEAFGRLDPGELSDLLAPAVEEAVRRDCGELWWYWGSSSFPSRARSRTCWTSTPLSSWNFGRTMMCLVSTEDPLFTELRVVPE